MEGTQNMKVGTVRSLGYLRDFRRDPIRLMEGLHRKYGDQVELSVGPQKILFCFHPDQAEKILKSQGHRYRRSRLVFDKILPLTGRNGLVQLEGEKGREERQLTGASLSFDALRAIYPLWIRSSLKGLEHIQEEGRGGREIDLAAHLTDMILRNAMILVFGEEPAASCENLIRAFVEANKLCGRKIRNLVSAPGFVPTRTNRRLKSAIRQLDAEIYELIRRRARSNSSVESGKDLLSVLIRAGHSEARIRDELVTFLFAGHETTASSLTWTFYLLSRNPVELERLQAECRGILGDRLPELEDLRRLSHTLNAYQESLRLFPPSWTLAREAIASDQIGALPVRRGTLVLLGLSQIQRHPQFWEEADRFVPSRFEKAEHPYSFIPFGGGSRICIGMRTALIEASLVLALFVPRARFHLRPGFEAEMEAMITAHPRAGLPVTVENLEPSR